LHSLHVSPTHLTYKIPSSVQESAGHASPSRRHLGSRNNNRRRRRLLRANLTNRNSNDVQLGHAHAILKAVSDLTAGKHAAAFFNGKKKNT